jgi:molecular chaperone GrpE
MTETADGEVVEDAQENADETDTKLAEMTEKCQRLAAEYYNYRERTAKEKASMYSDGARDTVEKILPVIDNLERAVAAQSAKCDEEDSFFKGVEMTLKQFKETLKAMGVEEIPAKGEKFDPNLHSAVSHIEDENFGENEITIEMMKGYKYKEKVIRHSMVQVAN